MGTDRHTNLQRFRIYWRRLWHMFAGSGLKMPCLYLHLPKCGGTSFSNALYAVVPLQARIGVIDAASTRRAAALLHHGRDDPYLCHEDFDEGARTFELRNGILAAHMCWQTRLIHGHVLYSDILRSPAAAHWQVITVMRDPVPRSLSNFRMNAHDRSIDYNVDAWLDSAIGWRHANVALRYLSGRFDIAPEDLPEARAEAVATLDRLALVGFLENIPKLLDDFEALFGPRLRLYRYNEAKGADITLTPAQRRKLEILCADDIDLYTRAQAKFA